MVGEVGGNLAGDFMMCCVLSTASAGGSWSVSWNQDWGCSTELCSKAALQICSFWGGLQKEPNCFWIVPVEEIAVQGHLIKNLE